MKNKWIAALGSEGEGDYEETVREFGQVMVLALYFIMVLKKCALEEKGSLPYNLWKKGMNLKRKEMATVKCFQQVSEDKADTIWLNWTRCWRNLKKLKRGIREKYGDPTGPIGNPIGSRCGMQLPQNAVRKRPEEEQLETVLNRKLKSLWPLPLHTDHFPHSVLFPTGRREKDFHQKELVGELGGRDTRRDTWRKILTC